MDAGSAESPAGVWRISSAPLRILSHVAEPPDIFGKQYILTAGPTPLPPSVSAGDGRADPLPPRPGVRRDLRQGAGAPAAGLPDAQRRALLRGHRERARWSRPSPTSSVPASRRWSPPAASSASAGQSSATPTAPTPCELDFEWGEKVDPARARRGARRPRRAHRGPCSHPVGDLDRRRSTTSGRSTSVATGRGSVLCVDAVSGLGAVDLPAGRVGGGRRGRGLAEVADVPAGAGVRLRLRPGDGARGRAPAGAATTSTGSAPPRGRGRSRRTRRSRPP